MDRERCGLLDTDSSHPGAHITEGSHVMASCVITCQHANYKQYQPGMDLRRLPVFISLIAEETCYVIVMYLLVEPW